jgi:hypothetical protein
MLTQTIVIILGIMRKSTSVRTKAVARHLVLKRIYNATFKNAIKRRRSIIVLSKTASMPGEAAGVFSGRTTGGGT